MRKLVSEVKKFSLANGIELVEWPPGPNLIAGGGYDLGIVASFGKLIPERLIQSFPRLAVFTSSCQALSLIFVGLSEVS